MGPTTSGLVRAGAWTGVTLALGAMHCAPTAADPLERPPLFAVGELRIGALHHDTPGLWAGTSIENAGVDANVEVLFAPWAKAFGGYLRPAVGATVNFNGDTSKVYADVRWEIEAPHGVFFGVGLGAALHDGHLRVDSPDHKTLGARVLFHPTIELGYRFDGVNSISIFADHVSNGYTKRDNDGMDTIGIRFGRRLGPAVAPQAADIPVADFSGPYIGAAAGYGLDGADWFAVAPSNASTGGVHAAAFAGYNLQSGQGIFGIEVDASPHKSSMSAACVGAVACRMDVHGLYSVRSRFGWVIGSTMIYGTAGVSIAPWDNSAVDLNTTQQLAGASAISYGVAVGGGIEYKLTPNFGVRAEIVHHGIPGWDLPVPGTGSVTNQFESTVGRAGITWYFK